MEGVPMTFAGGPTYMPPYLKDALKQKMFTDGSYLHLNSNSKEFHAVADAARTHIANILNIPNDFHIWFLGGGCHSQFAAIPLNFLGTDPAATANYTTTGYFSKLAFSEARRYCDARSICALSTDQQGYFVLPDRYDYHPQARYTHFIDNESVEGVSYAVDRYPRAPGIPLFNDCSSSFLTRQIDWAQVDMAYAHAQKNAGISGLSVMVLNERALRTAPTPILPELYSFENYRKNRGLNADMNILPIYANYVTAKHYADHGGLAMNNYAKRARRLYEVIDHSRIYRARAHPNFRSDISVAWSIDDPALLQQCLSEGEANNLYEFKGHRSIGGCRACLFAPIPDEAVYRLADFLEDFAAKHE